MKILLDTNILIHAANRNDTRRPMITSYLEGLVKRGDELCLAPQNIYEFWVVGTRPASSNGLGRTSSEVRGMLDQLLAAATLLPDPAELVTTWIDLCTQYGVMSRAAHDARLVAWMRCLGVGTIVTLNPGDFARFDQIRALHGQVWRPVNSWGMFRAS